MFLMSHSFLHCMATEACIVFFHRLLVPMRWVMSRDFTATLDGGNQTLNGRSRLVEESVNAPAWSLAPLACVIVLFGDSNVSCETPWRVCTIKTW